MRNPMGHLFGRNCRNRGDISDFWILGVFSGLDLQITKKNFLRKVDDDDVIGGSKCPFFINFFPKIFRKLNLIPPFHEIRQNKCQKWISRKKICIPSAFKIVFTPIIAIMRSENVFFYPGSKKLKITKNALKRVPQGLETILNDAGRCIF